MESIQEANLNTDDFKSMTEANINKETSSDTFESLQAASINNKTSNNNFLNEDSQHSTTNDVPVHSRSCSDKEKDKSLEGERDEENFQTIAKVSSELECENKEVLTTKIKVLDEPQWMFCSVPGCGFWTRKPERMTRHKMCHVDEVKLSFHCPGDFSMSCFRIIMIAF